MKHTFEYTVSEADKGGTVQEYLKNLGYSRHLIKHLKETAQGICKNGSRVYASEKLQPKDHLKVCWSEDAQSSSILPVKLKFSILYEDHDLMIIDKPADMPIHPSVNNYENTLANGIAWYFSEKGEPFTYRCINRLDRDTTGLLILAKHMLSASILSDMVKKRLIHREYLAIAAGKVPENGIIHVPIKRKPESVLERVADPNEGETAVTRYKRLAFQNNFSLVSLCLETGRTHQIRVHMKYLGHPLIGDYLYNPDYTYMKRQSLHSHRLIFTHPITGTEMSFESPLPEDMRFINWTVPSNKNCITLPVRS